MLNPDLALPLPTLPSLGVSEKQLPSDPSEVKTIVNAWFTKFSKLASSGDAHGLSALVHENGYWKDILAVTWDFRTFSGAERIRTMLSDQLLDARLSDFALEHEQYTGLQRPFPDLAWIQFCFRFEARGFARANGVIRLVPEAKTRRGQQLPPSAGTASGGLRSRAGGSSDPDRNGEEPKEDSKEGSDANPGDLVWKAHMIFTNLDGLKDHPEKLGALREQDSQPGNKWKNGRRKEVEMNEDPTVLVVGGAQAGMTIAARLKYLGVKVLVIEKEDRLGGNWRKRYDALCLHDPVCE
jgi:hypothetical protein